MGIVFWNFLTQLLGDAILNHDLAALQNPRRSLPKHLPGPIAARAALSLTTDPQPQRASKVKQAFF